MSHNSDETATLTTSTTDQRGRDWRRSQRENHPARRRSRDTEITRITRDKGTKPRRLLVEEARLACLLTEGEA